MHIKSFACGLGLSLIIASSVIIVFNNKLMTVLELADCPDHPAEECRKENREGRCCSAKL